MSVDELPAPAPTGPWQVSVLWRPRTPRLSRAWQARKERRARRRAEGRDRWYDNFDLPWGIDADELIVIVGLVIAAAAMVLFVVPAVLVLLDLLVLALLTLLLVPLRVLLRLPWTVLAVAPDGTEHRYRVVGWRRSRRTAAALQAHARAGGSLPGPEALGTVVGLA